jgi:hypothetical protein
MTPFSQGDAPGLIHLTPLGSHRPGFSFGTNNKEVVGVHQIAADPFLGTQLTIVKIELAQKVIFNSV